jgi:short-subunit dehydrogenase
VLWSQALQRELRGSGVALTCVCPSAVATPLLDDMPAANAGAKYVKPGTPDQIVTSVMKAIDGGKPWVFPREAKALQLLQRFAPRMTDRATRLMLRSS